MQPGAALRPVHMLAPMHTRVYLPRTGLRTGFPWLDYGYGDAQWAPIAHERAAWYEEPVAGNQLVHELDQWRATHKGPLNFNGSCAMPLYLAYSFLAIKSAHSALPYATSLKHTRPIVNHLPCTQYSPLYIGLVACQFH